MQTKLEEIKDKFWEESSKYWCNFPSKTLQEMSKALTIALREACESVVLEEKNSITSCKDGWNNYRSAQLAKIKALFG